MHIDLLDGFAIRELAPGDAPALFGLLAKPEIAEFIPDRFQDLDEMGEVVGWLVSNYGKPDFVRLSYALERAGSLVGVVSVGPLPSDESKRELSYFLDPAEWGRGRMDAAVGAFLERLGRRGLADELHAEVDVRNLRSIRLLERRGFTRLAEFAEAETGKRKYLYRRLAASGAVAADPGIEARLDLSEAERAEVEGILADCETADGASSRVQATLSINFHKELRGWFLCREGGRLVGLAQLFGPGEDEAELAAAVAPAARRRGVFSRLLSAALAETRLFGIGRVLATVDRGSAPGEAWAAAKGLPLSHTEYAMRLPEGAPLPEPGAYPLELSPAREADLPGMVGIGVAAFGDSEAAAEAHFRANMEATDREQYVAKGADGAVVGVCAFGLEGADASINGVCVDPALQGRGIGRAVVARAAAALRARGFGVVLEVDSTNERAHRLYLSLGFVAETTFDYFVLADAAGGR
ncbi:MAG: GNAT family N-acetyltransferase [Spirochaetaceae bacterium]|nr:GNAT family N-acetyltransferase [Spirochaetaceae bacterium]